ncbi:MAG: 4Fe-4S dicluster domain-containing protein [Desulfobacteraceae bacterium]|nr:4Fe-4S dicluster domain-containing protein [Desulfobacteraceae bacterium]
MKEIRYLDNVTTLDLNREQCIGCSLCTEVCPHNVFVLKEGKARIIDRDACMECGACVNNCPSEAISVNPGVG